MKILYSKYIPPKGFGAINLFGLVIVRKDYGRLTDAEENHERIHTRQMLEMLIIPFYIAYSMEWFIRLIQYRNGLKAYYNISFEREAYDRMYDSGYLKRRKLFSFIYYYKSKENQ